MNRKTESLSYPTNPLAAIRELQELDVPAQTTRPARQDLKQSLVALPTSSVVASATSSDASSASGSEVGRPRQLPKRKPNVNPMADAVREMLSAPYTADATKGPFTVSTVKIPAEISDRLGWVSKFSGKAKQEILAEALKDYFAKMLREG